MLTSVDIRRILTQKQNSTPIDDFRIIDSWIEYADKKKEGSINDRQLDYMCYEIEVLNPATGEKEHLFKAIKFCRVRRLPKSAKESKSFMDMHTQILTSVWENGINFVTVIANIMEPVALGLLFLYGVQGIGRTIDDAKAIANEDFAGFIGALHGTFRVMEVSVLTSEESEWLREKMYGMQYLTVVRGIPKAHNQGVDISKTGMDGGVANPDGQGTLEELIIGMTDYEYVVEILSTPVYNDTLKAWALRTEQDMTDWYEQLQGTKGFSFNLSVPMMYMANQSTSSGWSQAYTDAESVTYSEGDSYTTSFGENVGTALSETFGTSNTHSEGISSSESISFSNSNTVGETIGTTFGQTIGETIGETDGTTTGISHGETTGHSIGFGTSHSVGTTQGESFGTSHSVSETFGESTSHTETESSSWSKSVSNTEGNSISMSEGTSQNASFGTSSGTSLGSSTSESTSISDSVSTSESASESIGNSSSTSISNSESSGMSTSASQGSSSGISHGTSTSESVGNSYTTNSSTSVTDSVTHSSSHSTSESTSTSDSWTHSDGTSNSHSDGTSSSHSDGTSNSHSDGTSNTTSTGTSNSYTQGTSDSSGTSHGDTSSQGTSTGNSHTTSNSTGNTHTDSTNSSTSDGTNHTDTNGESGSITAGGSAFGVSASASVTTSGSESNGSSHTDTTGTGTSDSTSSTQTTSNGTTNTTTNSSGTTDTTSNSHSDNESWTNGTSNSQSNGTTSSDTSGTSSSDTSGTSSSDSSGTSSSDSYGGSTSTSSGSTDTTGTSVGHSVGQTNGFSSGTSYSSGTGTSTTESIGASLSQGQTLSETTGTSYGKTEGTSESVSTSVGTGTSHGTSVSTGKGTSQGSSQSTSQSFGMGTSSSIGWGLTESTGITESVGGGYSVSNGWGTSHSIGETNGTSHTLSTSQSVTDGTSQSYSDSFSNSVTNSQSQSHSDSRSHSVSNSESQSFSNSNSVTQGTSRGRSDGTTVSDSVGESRSTGTTKSEGTSKSVSNGTSKSTSSGTSRGESIGSSGAYASGTASSMGLGPSIGYSKSYQWVDQQVKDIIELLEFQNQRIKKALRGEGAMYTYVYIACPNADALATARAVAKSSWQNEFALTQPLQVLDLNEQEQNHLLYHFTAFSSDVTRENVAGAEEYKYATVLLPGELTALTHPPRVSEGGIYANIDDVPKFSVPSMMKGEIYLGTILSAERYSFHNGYATPYDYRLDEGALMHGIFAGASRSGKTVTAIRFAAELAKAKRKSTGKRLRLVCMDPKSDWRTLARYVEPERFKFYSLGNINFHPIKLNPWKIPKGVWPQLWIDGLIDIYCRAYGLLERGKQMMGETIYALYEEAGVFKACDQPDWKETTPELSKKVTFAKIYERMSDIKLKLEDPNNSKGRAGNDTRDAYARLLDRLQAFSREFSIERRLFSDEEGMGIDDLIGADDVTVLESSGLESTFSNFIFGVITSGFYQYAKAHEKGYLAEDQYETVLFIEEANKVLIGSDTASNAGQSVGLNGQSQFEEILDQSAGFGLFVFAVTQLVANMPSSIIANAGMIFAGRQNRTEDTTVIVRKIGKEERIEDRDVVKWMPMAPIGWFICQSSRGYDFKDAAPVLVKIARLNTSTPSNDELDEILAHQRVLNAINSSQTA